MSLDESSFDGSTKKKSNRPNHNIGQACNFCKKRHIKCNGEYPCFQCTKRGIQCSFGAKSKRGPKPKADLYEHCNRLMIDLEVQKQIAEYWKDQFMNALSKHGNDIELDSNINFDIDNEEDFITSTEIKKPNVNNLFNNGETHNPMQFNVDSVLDVENMDFNESISNTYTGSYPPQMTLVNESLISNALNEYCETVSVLTPEYEFFPLPEVAMHVWTSTKNERESIDDYATLISMLEHSIAASYGFQILLEPEIMRRFSKKTEDLLHILFFQKEVQCHSEFAQKLVILLSILSLFYNSDDKEGSKQSVIMLAYQIISMHRTQISPKMMHTVYFIMMVLSESQTDRVHWFNQANALASHVNISSVLSSCAPLVFVFNSLHPKGDLDSTQNLSRNELYQFIQTIEVMDQDLTMFNRIEFLDRERISEFIQYRDVMRYGILSELFYRLGNFEESQLVVMKSIQNARKIDKMRFVWSLTGLQCALETAAKMNMKNIVEEGISILDKFKTTYTIANRYKTRLINILNRNVNNSSSKSNLLVAPNDQKQYEHILQPMHYHNPNNNNHTENNNNNSITPFIPHQEHHPQPQGGMISSFYTGDHMIEPVNYSLYNNSTNRSSNKTNSYEIVNNQTTMFNVDNNIPTNDTVSCNDMGSSHITNNNSNNQLSVSGSTIPHINLDDLLMLNEDVNHPLFS